LRNSIRFSYVSRDDAVDENARRVDLIGIKLAKLDELLHIKRRRLPKLAIIGLKFR